MPDRRTFVIVGGGLAGARAAEGMREAGFAGRVVLVGAESELPYERPPLSKAYLRGEPAPLAVHDEGWYAAHHVELRLGTPVTAVDRAARVVELAGGERLGWDRLLLATGAEPRRLEVPGADLAGVHYVRTVADSAALRDALAKGGHLAVVGGGWLGLEVAAAARHYGAQVTLIEPQPTPLHSVLGPELGELFAQLHQANGVEVCTGESVTEFEACDGRVSAVLTDTGRWLPVDLAVVAVGVLPRTGLAAAAGLTVDDGVVVDELLRSPDDPEVFAAGDVARAYHPRYGEQLRVEHWATALEQGAAAGRSMAGKAEPYVRVPFAFTDQYDLGAEYRGWTGPRGYDVVVYRGEEASEEGEEQEEFVAFFLRERRVVAALNVNVWDQGEALDELVARQVAVDPDRLADTSLDLADLARG